jgi:hypothetical protein
MSSEDSVDYPDDRVGSSSPAYSDVSDDFRLSSPAASSETTSGARSGDTPSSDEALSDVSDSESLSDISDALSADFERSGYVSDPESTSTISSAFTDDFSDSVAPPPRKRINFFYPDSEAGQKPIGLVARSPGAHVQFFYPEKKFELGSILQDSISASKVFG